MPYYQGTATNYLTLLDKLRDFVTDTKTTWTAFTTYSVGDYIEPTTPNTYRYECIDAGTSGSTEPTWPTTIGDTVLDDVSTGDSVTWKCVNVLLDTNKWINKEETYSSSGDTDGLLWLEGIGVNSNKIYIGINTTRNVPSDYYNWELNGAIDWQTGLTFYTQSGCLSSSTVPYLLLRNGSISFTFWANNKRIIIYANVDAIIETAYLGLPNLYMPYSSWPYPLLIGGTSSTDQRYSSVTNHSWWLQPPNTDVAYLRDASGTWKSVNNTRTSSDAKIYFHPSRFLSGTSHELATNNDSSYLLIPMSMLEYRSSTASFSLFAELDGEYFVVGYALATGNTITVGSDDYYVIRNTYKTSIIDYACIKLD